MVYAKLYINHSNGPSGHIGRECASPAWQPVQSVKSFPELPVFRCINDLGGTIIGSFPCVPGARSKALALKTGPDDVPGKIPYACLIIGKNSAPDINIET